MVARVREPFYLYDCMLLFSFPNKDWFKTICIEIEEKMGEKKSLQSVQVFGRKKTATAVAHCKRGNGLIKVNGRPLALVEPRALRQKVKEILE